MKEEWIAIMRVAPYSGMDQRTVGKSQQKYLFKTDGIEDAVEIAKAIEQGIRSNPAVWNVWIEGIIQKNNGVDPG